MPESTDTTATRIGLSGHLATAFALEKRDIGGALVETVDARQLHAFLLVGKDFSTWMRDRIEQYDFIQDVDFCIFPSFGENSGRGRPAREYAVSLDMAKELSMVERNDRGKQARRYFIECERRAKAATSTFRPSPASHSKMDVARETRLTFGQNLRLAKMIGLNGNQAALSANRATVAMTGIDTLGLLGVTHMDAPQNEALLSPSDLARRAGISSAQKVNDRLCQIGLQMAFRDARGKPYYEPTDAGIRAGAVMQDTGKHHGNGTPIRQLRWAGSVADYLTPS
ncbi:antA/AntB antirepressor family protein [Sphingomonas sp. Marseille-Q8236]